MWKERASLELTIVRSDLHVSRFVDLGLSLLALALLSTAEATSLEPSLTLPLLPRLLSKPLLQLLDHADDLALTGQEHEHSTWRQTGVDFRDLVEGLRRVVGLSATVEVDGDGVLTGGDGNGGGRGGEESGVVGEVGCSKRSRHDDEAQRL